jgi:hypothetical protein
MSTVFGKKKKKPGRFKFQKENSPAHTSGTVLSNKQTIVDTTGEGKLSF